MCDFCQYDHETSEHNNIFKSEDVNKSLPKKYHDMPRFPMILDYEKEFKDNYRKQVEAMTIQLTKKLLQFSK